MRFKADYQRYRGASDLGSLNMLFPIFCDLPDVDFQSLNHKCLISVSVLKQDFRKRGKFMD